MAGTNLSVLWSSLLQAAERAHVLLSNNRSESNSRSMESNTNLSWGVKVKRGYSCVPCTISVVRVLFLDSAYYKIVLFTTCLSGLSLWNWRCLHELYKIFHPKYCQAQPCLASTKLLDRVPNIESCKGIVLYLASILSYSDCQQITKVSECLSQSFYKLSLT